MIEPDDVEATAARSTPDLNVILRIEKKAIRTPREILCPCRIVDRTIPANEDAAALDGGRFTRVGDDRRERRRRDLKWRVVPERPCGRLILERFAPAVGGGKDFGEDVAVGQIAPQILQNGD
jgi:hypothetical protein